MGSHVESVQSPAAEGAVGQPIHGHRVCLQHAACGGKDVDHWPRHGLPPTAAGDDVPLSIRAHAVQAPVRPAEVLPEYVQHREIAQRVFVSQGIGAEVSEARIVALYQVQCPLIQRHQQSVERRRPVGHALKCPTAFGVGVWIKPQHRAVISRSSFGIRRLGSVNQIRPLRSMARSLGVLWRCRPTSWEEGRWTRQGRSTRWPSLRRSTRRGGPQRRSSGR